MLDNTQPLSIINGMLTEFKKFILRGNVVDLAVGVVIGAAFTSVVNALVRDFLTPLIGSIQGKQDFAKNVFVFHHVSFAYGDFLNALLVFVLTASVVFFSVVQPINHLTSLANRRKQTPDPTTRKCPQCLSEIPTDAHRCMYCTSTVKPAKS
jgi:large conductance mechanosensitive channel